MEFLHKTMYTIIYSDIHLYLQIFMISKMILKIKLFCILLIMHVEFTNNVLPINCIISSQFFIAGRFCSFFYIF